MALYKSTFSAPAWRVANPVESKCAVWGGTADESCMTWASKVSLTTIMLSCWRLSLVSWTDLVVLSGINFDQPHCINKSRGKVGSLFVGAMVPVAVHLQLAELAELGKKQMHHFVSPDLFSSKTHYNLETS